MKKFLRLLFYFSLPIILVFVFLLAMYFYYDPFSVVRKHKNFSYASITPNLDYITTEVFVQNKSRYQYNSFIMGSSRTLAFKTRSWQNYLSPGDSPYIMDGASESIYGIYTKLQYLESIRTPLKNILIIFCRDVTFYQSKNTTNPLYIKHPLTSGESKLSFQLTFLKAYFTPSFLYKYYAYKIIGHYRPFMYGTIEHRKLLFDSITNEITMVDKEAELAADPTGYYAKRTKIFYKRGPERTNQESLINGKILDMVLGIRQILDRNHSNYKIVISPLYEQIKFSDSDKKQLTGIFGKNIYDFSGKNWFTDSITHFYEDSHYRPMIGDSILKIIYSDGAKPYHTGVQ